MVYDHTEATMGVPQPKDSTTIATLKCTQLTCIVG